MEHELIQLLRKNYDQVIEVYKDDLTSVRVGRAKPDLVENVLVQAYGTKMRLMEVASITAPDTNMILVSPYDKGLLREIEKAIGDSEMGLSGQVSGDLIRIVIPALTQERRLDFVKLLKQKTESGKILLRQARQEVKEKIDDLKKEGSGVSEDVVFSLHEQLDKITEEYMEKIEEIARAKEKEIMEV